MGSGDIDLLKRLISVLGNSEHRVLVNVGDYKEEYKSVPDNIYIDSWYPQPSVIPQCDLVIHHGEITASLSVYILEFPQL